MRLHQQAVNAGVLLLTTLMSAALMMAVTKATAGPAWSEHPVTIALAAAAAGAACFSVARQPVPVAIDYHAWCAEHPVDPQIGLGGRTWVSRW